MHDFGQNANFRSCAPLLCNVHALLTQQVDIDYGRHIM